MLISLTPKRHILARNASFDVLRVKIGSGAWSAGRWKNRDKKVAE